MATDFPKRRKNEGGIRGYDKEYHRAYSSGKRYMWGTCPEGFVRRVAETIARSDSKRTSTILDVGCGEGRHCAYISSVGFRVVGVDVSRVALHRGLRQDSGFNFELVLGECARLPLKEEVFDSAIDVYTLEFVPKKERYAEEISRVLKRGGYLFAREARRKTGEEPHSVDQGELMQALEKAGMKVSDLRIKDGGLELELVARRL